MIRHFTREQVEQMAPDPQSWRLMEQWLAAGKGIAVYQNQDLGSLDIGRRQFVSYGIPAAQIETDTPPERLPDIGTAINWRYILEGVCRDGE